METNWEKNGPSGSGEFCYYPYLSATYKEKKKNVLGEGICWEQLILSLSRT